MSRPSPMGSGFGGAGLFGSGFPAPRDLIAILVVSSVTFVMQFFSLTAIVPEILRLSPLVLKGALWQLVSYPFVGFWAAGFWFPLEMVILYWFGKDVFWRLGRRRFWPMVLWTVTGAAIAAMLVHILILVTGIPTGTAFFVMQGHRMLITVFIAAYATLFPNRTIFLMFVLPLKASWFIGLEILLGFLGFLFTKDYAGFVGICAAVALTYSFLVPGGLRLAANRLKLRIQRLLMEQRLERMRRNRRFDVIDGDDKDRWVH